MKNRMAKMGLMLGSVLLGCPALLPAPAAAAKPAALIDDLHNWSMTAERSSTLTLLSNMTNADDPTRVQRSGAYNEYIVYKAPGGFSTFTVYAYASELYKPYDHLQFFTSADGVSYQAVIPQIYEDGGNLSLLVYEAGGLPEGSRFLKIRYKGGIILKSPSIGKVVLGSPASVQSSLPSGIVPLGSQVTLSTATEDARIYYTTDGSDPKTSAARKLYTAPIDLPASEVLDLAAFAEITDGANRQVGGRISRFNYAAMGPEDLHVPASADTFVDEAQPDKSFGSAQTLYMRRSRGKEAYFRFDLRKFNEEADTVKLLFYGNASDSTREPAKLQLYPAADSWSEAEATYRKKPALLADVPLAEKVLSYGLPGWMQFDITAYAREQKRLGRTSISLALRNDTQGTTQLSSREAGEKGPFLKIMSGGGLSPSGMVDPLDSFKLLYKRSNILISSNDTAYFGGDVSRFTRLSTSPGFIVYELGPGVRSFMASSYFYTGIPMVHHRMYISTDGRDYRELPVTIYPSGAPSGNWQQYIYESSSVPEGSRYLKIEILGESKSWTPQLSKVSLNQHTSSVQMVTASVDGAVKVEMTTPSAPARIYFREGGAGSFKTYPGPLVLSGYHTLEAYAVKNGLEASPVRNFKVNATGQSQVDRFGQMMTVPFAGKVSSDEELAADAAEDEAYYGALQAPANRDKYGGLKGSSWVYGIPKTGFFDIRRAGGRKIMTTPEGNVYFSLGMNGITPNETYTKVTGREQSYEWIPNYTGEYRAAFLGSQDHFSYYLANKYRKTGRIPSSVSFYTEAVDRLKKWGFNGAGAWTPLQVVRGQAFPYTAMLPMSGLPAGKLEGLALFDIFAAGAEEQMEKAFAASLPALKDDPMLIGYFIDNEYDYHKFYTSVPKLKGGTAMKRKLVDMLRDQYGTVDAFNQVWQTNYGAFEDLYDAELNVRPGQPYKDMDAFFRLYLDTFYGTVSRLFRQYDGNHLLLGDRWITMTAANTRVRGLLAEASGKYLDAISINHYSAKLDKDMLSDVHTKSGGKAILLSEFSFGTAEQGLKPIVPGSASSQHERQLRYRSYVEEAASLGYVVGAHWFDYVDQAPTGRYWEGYGGERYNSGLVNVADRPYKELLEGIMATHRNIYNVLMGQSKPFQP
ncbi:MULTISPECIES: CBM96 family carbohydrate-binding protein [Paenibacillus]|uniref:CBM96 family carbohydrate-binding protein n=1 Tax=Paenibacillus TaxID=44249 RepID=UPI0022B92561|nr:DNRLRE domain-containing protein [Paenibacillus caseinilyticus]MCZ8523162.1 DNRLRE domain-containing protein [Paenibacillus caseinilyticus]